MEQTHHEILSKLTPEDREEIELIISENEKLKTQLNKLQEDSFGKTLQINGLKSQIENLSKIPRQNTIEINQENDVSILNERLRDITCKLIAKEKEVEDANLVINEAISAKDNDKNRIKQLEDRLVSFSKIEREKLEFEKKAKALADEKLNAENKAGRLQDELKGLEQKNEELNAIIDDLDKRQEELNTSIKNETNEEIANLSARLNSLELDKSKNHENLQDKNAQIEDQESKINELSVSLNSYRELCRKYQKQILDINCSEAISKELEVKNQQLTDSLTSLNNILETKTTEIDNLQRDVRTYQQNIRNLSDELDMTRKSAQNAITIEEYHQMKMKIMILQNEVDSKDSQLEKA